MLSKQKIVSIFGIFICFWILPITTLAFQYQDGAAYSSFSNDTQTLYFNGPSNYPYSVGITGLCSDVGCGIATLPGGGGDSKIADFPPTETDGYCDRAQSYYTGGSSPTAQYALESYLGGSGDGVYEILFSYATSNGSFSSPQNCYSGYAVLVQRIGGTWSLYPVPSGDFVKRYTLPMNPADYTITSWFDHDASSSQMTKYTGTVYSGSDADISSCTSGCYDGHHGIDFGTSAEEKNILAAAGGVVTAVGWQNPSDHSQGYGYRAIIYHSQSGQSTVYAHATTTQTFIVAGDTVLRGQVILLSGMTGDATGPHLHFGVFDNNSDADADALDPYGWNGGGSDPRANDVGYVWSTNPPSLYDTISSNITSTTTWETNHMYIVSGNISTNSGVPLTIEPGAFVKFASGANLTINGPLDAEGSTSTPIYITSLKDDSVWGDTNMDATSTSPALGDWGALKLDSTSSSTIENTYIKYGSFSSFGSKGFYINEAH